MLEDVIKAYESGTEDERRLVVSSKIIAMSMDGKKALRFLGKDERATFIVDEERWTDHRTKGDAI